MRTRLAFAACALALVAGAAAIALRANLRLTPGPIEASRLDEAILAGIEYLDRTDGFRTTFLQGGPGPPEAWIAKRILEHEPHPGLAEDVRIGWEALLRSPAAALAHLPGEPARVMTRADRATMDRLLEIAQGWDSWFFIARFPELARDRPEDLAAMLDESLRNSYGYRLTHRIVAYRFMRALNPEEAAAFDVPAREDRAVARLYREMLLDPRLSDLYFERVAVLLQGSAVSRPVHRWIERVLQVQRSDGGWPRNAALVCDLVQLPGLACDRGDSRLHPTFLAVWALVQYRERV